MSTVTKQIAAVEFQANSRMANAAIESMRKSAQDCRTEVEKLQGDLAKGLTMTIVNGQDMDINQRIKELKAMAKAFDQAAQSQVRGVKAFDELWKHAKTGSIEQLTGAQIKAGMNGAKPQLDRLKLGSDEDRAKASAIQSMLEESQKVLNRMKLDTDQLIQTLQSGEGVAEATLKRERDGLREMLTLIPQGTAEWEQYNAQLQKIQGGLQKIRESTGADVLAKAQRGEFATASTSELSEAIAKLKEYQSLIADPKGTGAETFAATKEQIKALTAAYDELAEKTKAGFANADEVIQRFNQHLGETKIENINAQAQTLAQTLDEKLSQATSEWDEDIQRETENLNKYEQELKETQERLASLQAKYDEVQQRYQNRSALGKATLGRRDKKFMAELDSLINGNDEYIGAKGWVEYDKRDVEGAKARLKEYKERKAEALGLTETVEQLNQAEQAGAEQTQKAHRMAREEMTQGIKVLEDEAFAIDRTTTDGQKRYNQLRQTIDDMNRELKESTGEWMSLADAQTLAGEAGTKAFIASPEQLQKATAAIERRKKQLQETIQLQRRSGEATDAEEKELKELELQLKKLKMEQDNFNMSHSRMDTLLKQPTNAKNLDELRAAIKRAKAELNSMEDSLGKNSKAYKEMAANTKKAEIQLKEMEAQSKGTASAFDKAWSRLKTYVGLYVGAAVAMQKLSQAMGDLLTLSDKMGEVRKTTDFTADEVGRLSDNLAKLDTRTSLTSLMELSSLAGSVGLKTQEQVQGFTEAADQLIVALPELGNESARTIIKIANATGDLEKNGGNVRETLEKVGSTIIALRANSASAAGPITDFVSRVGAVGAQAGISIDQIAALGSTIDALGGRVEMSATALSRMIPAIKNNSFAIANSINVTEEYLKSLAPMEQMVLIFQKMRDNIQHIDTSTEEGMNAMADNVEAFLGKNATMREVMKDLEQQGARAGIVFGLLSQNVDELEKQLGIASEAYEKNTALAKEFNNMNETTAAKWERLKNQIEEMFVRDQAQRLLGGIIYGLRKIVDWIAEDGPIVKGLKIIAVYAAAMKLELGASIASAGGAFSRLATGVGAFANLVGTHLGKVGSSLGLVTARTRLARMEWAKMDAAMKANIWGAVIAALGAIAYKLWDMHKAAKEAAAEVGRFNQKVADEKKALDDLFTPLQKSNIAQDERSKLISEINSKYGKYLGFMLSETNSAIQLADAHALIAKRIREEAYEKRILEQEDKVRSRHNEDVNAAYGNIEEQVRKGRRGNADVSEVSDILKSVIDRNLGNISGVKNAGDLGGNRYVELSAAAREDLNSTIEALVQNGKISRQNATLITGAVMKYAIEAKEQYEDMQNATASTRADLRNVQRSIRGDVNAGLNGLVNRLKNFGQTSAATTPMVGVQRQKAGKSFQWGKQENGETPDWVWDPTKRSQQQVQMPLLNWKPNIDKKNIEQVKRYVEAQDQLRSYLEANAGRIDEQTRKTAEMYLESEESLKELRSLIPAGSGGGGGQFNNGSNSPTPYGTYNRITSPYIDWDADALVSRRKEMLERVRALANGADVQAVLSEDAKFITEATRKNIKTTRDAIEWYNTERLKIQDALHEKHLTNTGDWMDPTGRRKREKTVKDEWSTYLNELDAYYTERKAKIQEQQNDGEISEAESWRRQLTNEAEWRQRRAELQQLYARKSAEVTEEEQQAIFNIIGERTGDSADFIQKTIAKTVQFIYDIGKHSEAEMNNLFGRMDKGSEQDFLRQRNAIGKQMDAIRDIIEKERPFNGITENLQENLTKMGVLFGDMDDEMKRLMAAGEDMAEFNAKQEQERVRRLSFLLQEAEHAYNTNIEEVMRHMAEAGMTAWVDYLKNNTDAQNALMAQLHTTFDKVQEAIKKEATLWKKEAENMWNNILLPDGETTLKQLADRTVAALSLDENRVSRANSLIGAGQASERVADRLALQQMRVQLAMQEHYYNIMHQRGRAAIDDLERQAKLARERGDIEEATRKELNAQHARMTLNLATAKEETDLAKQREEIIARTEESQNRLYTAMKEWAELLSSSLQSVFEATHAGDAEYFNERAKLNLTGKGGPGAGTYIIIDNEGTSDATAHYEYLNEREALERQREIANQNALADALKKALDDINMKMSEQITDWINASLQSASLDANTQAVLANTEALYETAGEPAAKPQGTVAAGGNGRASAYGEGGGEWMPPMEMPEKEPGAEYMGPWTKWAEVSSKATETMVGNNKKVEKSTKASFAAMTAAANMYGIAYQAMSNENLSTAQKVEMMIVQAAGQAAISMLTASLAASEGETAANAPSWISKTLKELGPIGGPVAVGVFTALIGGLMGLATSKITKSKSEIAQVTGASHASAGRLSTGMLQYAEGNVNEFTDPSTLQTGKQYNVDAADGRTYRARFMGKGAKTHITHGPEFHLVGEAGREAIIDAKTTQNIRMNEPEIWRTIQILSGGGRISAMRRRGRGVAAFADGNVDEMGSGGTAAYGESGLSPEQVMAMQASLDRNSEVLERALEEGIKGIFDVYGKDGLVETYDRGKKTMSRYGKRY